MYVAPLFWMPALAPAQLPSGKAWDVPAVTEGASNPGATTAAYGEYIPAAHTVHTADVLAPPTVAYQPTAHAVQYSSEDASATVL